MSDIKINDKTKKVVFNLLAKEFDKQLKEKGPNAVASQHEALGILTEEFWEVVEAVTSNDMEQILHEYIDIAISAILNIASITAENTSAPCPCCDQKRCALHYYLCPDESCECNCINRLLP